MYALCESTEWFYIDCLQCEFPLTIDTEAVQSQPRIVVKKAHTFLFVDNSASLSQEA